MSDLKLPIVRAADLIKTLEKLGFTCTRKSKGSHFRYVHPDGRKTTVPVHRGKDISRGSSEEDTKRRGYIDRGIKKTVIRKNSL